MINRRFFLNILLAGLLVGVLPDNSAGAAKDSPDVQPFAADKVPFDLKAFKNEMFRRYHSSGEISFQKHLGKYIEITFKAGEIKSMRSKLYQQGVYGLTVSGEEEVTGKITTSKRPPKPFSKKTSVFSPKPDVSTENIRFRYQYVFRMKNPDYEEERKEELSKDKKFMEVGAPVKLGGYICAIKGHPQGRITITFTSDPEFYQAYRTESAKIIRDNNVKR